MSMLIDAASSIGADLQAHESPVVLPPPPPPPPSVAHRCQICQRSYVRADHLTRHLRSHENSRPFQCQRCPKNFNRIDLLNRHVATHERNIGQNRPEIRKTERAGKACIARATAKSKCEEQKPCLRCRNKNIVCETKESSYNKRRASSKNDTRDSP